MYVKKTHINKRVLTVPTNNNANSIVAYYVIRGWQFAHTGVFARTVFDTTFSL